MRTAAILALLAAGAILTFAVSARVPGINLRLAGVIIMATGVAALVAPSPATARVRRWLALPAGSREAPPDESADAGDLAYPAYLLQDPAVLAAEVLNSAQAARSAPAGAAAPTGGARAALRPVPDAGRGGQGGPGGRGGDF